MQTQAPGRISFGEAVAGQFVPTHVGVTLGPAWSTHWFEITATVPPDWAGARDTEVHLLFDAQVDFPTLFAG